jgi:capsular polysaccharide biosynthesis protein
LFSHCKELISIHGAGLSNALFMQKGSMVIELMAKKEEWKYNDCYITRTKKID